jgi:hypothetical protein
MLAEVAEAAHMSHGRPTPCSAARCVPVSFPVTAGHCSVRHDDLNPAGLTVPRLPEPFTDRLQLAVAAYLASSKASCREHTEPDLRCCRTWCAERGLYPLAARRPHLELYIRWMQEIGRFRPSTVSRRFSVTAGFYRTCVLDGILEHSPAL